MPIKTGPLSAAELQELWVTVVSDEYSQPLIDNPDSGFESYQQGFEQMARVSTSIDRTTQAMFILPFSGQTDEPASGARLATVTVTGSRTSFAVRPVVFTAGQVVFLHIPEDYSPQGPISTPTGRKYVVTETVTFLPGDIGPLDITLASDRPGYGYNLPQPQTIVTVEQVGVDFFNDQATVIASVPPLLQVRPDPDVVIPEHVGRYVEFTNGANVGVIRRIIDYVRPDSTVPHGGIVTLSAQVILRAENVVGTFVAGETIEQAVSGATGVFIAGNADYVIIENRTTTLFVSGQALTGVQSLATADVQNVDDDGTLVAETTASWRILDWSKDLTFTFDQPDFPEGGKSPMLDELGDERAIPRAPGETDIAYRKRVATLPDTVSPNALLRSVNKILAPFNLEGCLREIGQPKFRGLFHDGDPSDTNPDIAYAYDFDFAVRPADRFKLAMNYEEFRAFFLITIPPMAFGDFGIAYDAGSFNAYDAKPFLTFHDGFAATAATIRRAIWQDIETKRAGGVGWELVEDTGDCD